MNTTPMRGPETLLEWTDELVAAVSDMEWLMKNAYRAMTPRQRNDLQKRAASDRHKKELAEIYITAMLDSAPLEQQRECLRKLRPYIGDEQIQKFRDKYMYIGGTHQ